MRTARLSRIEDDLALRCHTMPDLVVELKSWIPAQWRTWDYEGRFWRVHSSQELALRALLHALDYRVEEQVEHTRVPQSSKAGREARAAAHGV